MRVEKCVAGDKEGIGALACKCGKGRIDLADRRGVEYPDLQPDGAGSFLQVPPFGAVGRISGRIPKHGNPNGLGHKLMQESPPFGVPQDPIEARCFGGRWAEAVTTGAAERYDLSRVALQSIHDRLMAVAIAPLLLEVFAAH
jgi:hypothetical protein